MLATMRTATKLGGGKKSRVILAISLKPVNMLKVNGMDIGKRAKIPVHI